LVALIAVSMALLGAFVEAVGSVSRKPAWSQPRPALGPVFQIDRRTQRLPFVGVDRRRVVMADPRGEIDRLAA
jgi:hypothetical protein